MVKTIPAGETLEFLPPIYFYGPPIAAKTDDHVEKHIADPAKPKEVVNDDKINRHQRRVKRQDNSGKNSQPDHGTGKYFQQTVFPVIAYFM